MRFFLLLFGILSSLSANLLQEAIDNASPYATIKLHRGYYKGNIIIEKPLSIVGVEDGVLIEGNGDGSVVKIHSSFVRLVNLTITKSGNRMDRLDAAISIKHSKKCEILHCKLKGVLYGIDMDMVTHSHIAHNFITSNGLDTPLRGDAMKLYYSHNNLIEQNTIQKSRDVTLNYSNANSFKNNIFLENRFALHIALSKETKVFSNHFRYNSVGVMLMGAKDTKVQNNEILSSRGAAGIGVMIGAVSNLLFENNSVKYNAKALYIDGKEKERGIKRFIIGNEIAYNKEAFHFHATIKDNKIVNNRVYGNIDDIVKDIDGRFDASNRVEYNYWDSYVGFDRDGDGVGDTPYEVYQYADQLWHYNKKVKFFYASPIMTLLNFLSQLAPFIEPNLIFVDKKPIYQSFSLAYKPLYSR
jgi:nitrous oxidase accessory protein